MKFDQDTSIDRQLNDALATLQQHLALVDRPTRKPKDGFLEFLVLRIGHVKLRIDASQNHGRPHFHIDFKQQYSCSYAIDNFECLAGNMPRKYADQVLDWARENQDALYSKWEELHPTSNVFALELEGRTDN